MKFDNTNTPMPTQVASTQVVPTQVANDDARPAPLLGFVDSLNRWIKVNGMTRSLNRLDDRTLKDIGISRIEIREHAERLLNRDKTAA